MSVEITTTFQNKYSSNLELLSMQLESRFRKAVDIEDCRGSEGARVVNQLGSVNPVKRTVRHGDTPRVDTPHDARWVYPEDYEISDLIDRQDQLRTLIEPTSKMARNFAVAMNRAQDDEIIDAFFSDSTKTGKTGATTTDWTTFIGANTAHHYDATSGMTVEALRAAKEALEAAEVDIEMDPLFVGISAKQHRNLLSETQAISLDYNEKPVLVEGRITNFMGFNFIHSERLAVDGSSRRRCPAWAKSGMCMGIWEDVRGEVDRLPGKSYTTQVYASTTIGATRTEEVKVVEIACTES